MGCIDGKRNRRMQVQSTTRSSLPSIPARASTQPTEEANASPFASILGTQQAQTESRKQSAPAANEAREQDCCVAAVPTLKDKGAAEIAEANAMNASKSNQPNSKPEEPKSKRAGKATDCKTDPNETIDKPDAASDNADQHPALLAMMMTVAAPPPDIQPAPPTNKNSDAVPASAAEKSRLNSQIDNPLPQQAPSKPSPETTASFSALITSSPNQKSAKPGMPLHPDEKAASAGMSANAPSDSQHSVPKKDLANAVAAQANSPAVESVKAEQAVTTDKVSAAPKENFAAPHDSNTSVAAVKIGEDADKTTRLEVDAKTSISVVHAAAATQHTRRDSANSSHSGESRNRGAADQQQIAGAQVSLQVFAAEDAKSVAAKSEPAMAPPQLSQISTPAIAGQQSAPAIHADASSGNHEALNPSQAQPANASHAASATPSLSSARLVAHQQYSEVQLNIHSQDLGALQIRATMRAGQIGAAITAERPEAREALASAIPALHQTLRDRDVKVEQITIADRTSTLADFNSGTRSQSGFSQQQSSQNPMPSTAQYAISEHEPVIAMEPSRAINESALVDIHA
jgi:flagellar hook-length control protein FliK